MLVRFRGRIFGRDGNQWQVWEPRWDSVRPIDGQAWNGKQQVLQDERQLGDLFSPDFGFGGQQEKCMELTAEWADKMDALPESKDVPMGRHVVWWKDGWVAITSLEVRPDSWKARHKYLQTRPRTCRNPPRGKRSTKRNLK